MVVHNLKSGIGKNIDDAFEKHMQCNSSDYASEGPHSMFVIGPISLGFYQSLSVSRTLKYIQYEYEHSR